MPGWSPRSVRQTPTTKGLKVPGGTIERVETDADGNPKYEAHMTNADGNRVTVYVNADFEVVSVESGR